MEFSGVGYFVFEYWDGNGCDSSGFAGFYKCLFELSFCPIFELFNSVFQVLVLSNVDLVVKCGV